VGTASTITGSTLMDPPILRAVAVPNRGHAADHPKALLFR
jgi:hypothetical protein